MYYEHLKEAYKMIYRSVSENSILARDIPCFYILEVMTNLNMIILDHRDSQHSYLRARLIANQDYSNAVAGMPYQDRFR